MQTNNEAPNLATVFFDGSHYKTGRAGRVYRWNGEEWIRSTKAAEAVRAAARRQGLKP